MFPAVFALCAVAQIPLLDQTELTKAQQTQVLTASVRVLNFDKKDVGTGVIVAKTGSVAYVVTAAHVVEGSKHLEVQTFSAQSYPKKDRDHVLVSVVARRAENGQDLALLRIADYQGDSSGLPICPRDAAPKDKLAGACAAGCRDGGKAPTLRREPIEASVLALKPGSAKPTRFWQTKRVPVSGESGGPLVDAKGRLIGICSGASGDHGYYCHLDDIHLLLRGAGLGTSLGKLP